MMTDGLLFSSRHIWVKKDGKDVLLGLSDHARKQLKAILFINLPEEGTELRIDEKFGDVESVKTVSDLVSPVSGRVIAVNQSVVDEPDAVNGSPYDSWLLRVSADALSDSLMDHETYERCKEQL